MKKLLSIPFICLLFSINSNAQLLNKLKEKAGSAVNKAASSTAQNSKQAHTEDNASSTPISSTITSSNISNKSKMDNSVIPDAKFYFSDQPFTNNHNGAKTSFKSSDFIYGRLELNKQTVEEAYRLKKSQYGNYYLFLEFVSFKGDKRIGSENVWNTIWIPDDNIKNTWLNFDVLPDPENASTVTGVQADFGKTMMGAGPMYSNINQNSFPDNGEYTIKVQVYFKTFDAWGNASDNPEEWPAAKGSFQFLFNGNDVATLEKNAAATITSVQNNLYKLDQLPDWFKNSTTVNDPKLSHANIAAILKRDLAEFNMEVIKFNIRQFSGPLWQIQKNDLGAIDCRYVTPDINIAYRFQGKCYLGTVRLRESYMGGGKYSQLFVGDHTPNGGGQLIDCSAIK